MKKHFWIGPPEHQNPSDHVELWLEDGDVDETKPKRSKKGETKKEDQYLLVRFDTEFNKVNINLVGLAQTGIEYIPVS